MPLILKKYDYTNLGITTTLKCVVVSHSYFCNCVNFGVTQLLCQTTIVSHYYCVKLLLCQTNNSPYLWHTTIVSHYYSATQLWCHTTIVSHNYVPAYWWTLKHLVVWVPQVDDTNDMHNMNTRKSQQNIEPAENKQNET